MSISGHIEDLVGKRHIPYFTNKMGHKIFPTLTQTYNIMQNVFEMIGNASERESQNQ